MSLSKHDFCGCEKYKPNFASTGIRYTGSVFRCRRCVHYVDGTKWLGGIIKYGNRSRVVRYYECPCCGYRMTNHRRAKYKIIKSIERQMNNPNIQPAVRKLLPIKIKIVNKMHLSIIH